VETSGFLFAGRRPKAVASDEISTKNHPPGDRSLSDQPPADCTGWLQGQIEFFFCVMPTTPSQQQTPKAL